MINPNPPGFSLHACEGAERAARSYKLWRGYKLKATRRATTRAGAGSGQDPTQTERTSRQAAASYHSVRGPNPIQPPAARRSPCETIERQPITLPRRSRETQV